MSRLHDYLTGKVKAEKVRTEAVREMRNIEKAMEQQFGKEFVERVKRI